MFVYLTTNLINGKKYIGYTTRNDKNYKGSGSIIKSAIKKYGKENFSLKILEKCSSLKKLYFSEIKWIKKYNAVEDNNFYNLCYGGYGGNPKTLKKYWSKIKDRKNARNWNINPTYGMLGKKHSEKTKKLIGFKSINRNWGRKTNVIGSNNPRAKKILVNNKLYGCIKDFALENNINYSTLKSYIARNTVYKNLNMEIKYV
jgi:hypothetical protein